MTLAIISFVVSAVIGAVLMQLAINDARRWEREEMELRRKLNR